MTKIARLDRLMTARRMALLDATLDYRANLILFRMDEAKALRDSFKNDRSFFATLIRL